MDAQGITRNEVKDLQCALSSGSIDLSSGVVDPMRTRNQSFSKALRSSRNALLALFLLLLLVVHILCWFHQTPFLGHDQCYLLFEARRVLAGVPLYGPHLAEANPPLIVWFSELSVLLGRALHISETRAFQLFVCLLVLLSTLWCLRIARRVERLAGLASLLLLAAAVLAVETPLQARLLGQRENLFVIFFLPYALAIGFDVAARLSPWERVLLGAVAGLGVCFKPHQVLAIIGIELAVLLVRRSLRHLLSFEVLAATLACVFYVGLIYWLTPLYLTVMLPILGSTYWAIGSHSAVYLALHQLPEMAVLLVLVAATSLVKPRSLRLALACLLASALASSAAYDIQHTEWGYHLYPVIAFLALATAALALLLLAPVMQRRDAPASPLLAAGLLLIVAVVAVAEQRIPPDTDMPNDGGAFAGLAPGEPVSILSTGAEMFPIAYRRDLNWASRFQCLWMLPALVKNSPGERQFMPSDAPFHALSAQRLAQLSTLQRTQTAEDLEYWRPRVIIVQKCPCDFIEDPSFDVLAWFRREPAFERAWSHYRAQQDTPNVTIYRRAD